MKSKISMMFMELQNMFIFDDAFFFNRNWAGACSGCWAGLGLILGWSASCASSGLG